MKNRGTQAQAGDRVSARPGPSDVPNESRGPESQQGQHQGGSQTQYRGGRQTQGSVPIPDDPNDHESAGSFRGTAIHPGADKNYDLASTRHGQWRR